MHLSEPSLHGMWCGGIIFILLYLYYLLHYFDFPNSRYLPRAEMHDHACLRLFFFWACFFFSPCSLDRPISKRCASLSTCVLGKLSQELHKLQTYPRTDVGAGTPGKKRNVLNDLDHERYANYGETLGNN